MLIVLFLCCVTVMFQLLIKIVLLYTFIQMEVQHLFPSLWNLLRHLQRRNRISACCPPYCLFRMVRMRERSSFLSWMIQSLRDRKCFSCTSVIQREVLKSQTVHFKVLGHLPRSQFLVKIRNTFSNINRIIILIIIEYVIFTTEV